MRGSRLVGISVLLCLKYLGVSLYCCFSACCKCCTKTGVTCSITPCLSCCVIIPSWHLPPPPFMTHSNKPISLSVQYGNLICLALPCIRWGKASYGLCTESSHPPAAWVLIKYWNRSYCRMTMSFFVLRSSLEMYS